MKYKECLIAEDKWRVHNIGRLSGKQNNYSHFLPPSSLLLSHMILSNIFRQILFRLFQLWMICSRLFYSEFDLTLYLYPHTSLFALSRQLMITVLLLISNNFLSPFDYPSLLDPNGLSLCKGIGLVLYLLITSTIILPINCASCENESETHILCIIID